MGREAKLKPKSVNQRGNGNSHPTQFGIRHPAIGQQPFKPAAEIGILPFMLASDLFTRAHQ